MPTKIKSANDRGNGTIIVDINDERFVLTPTRVNRNGFSIYMQHYDDFDSDDEMGDNIPVTTDGMAESSKEAWSWAAENFRALADACAKQAKK